jgi:hypothetical protein
MPIASSGVKQEGQGGQYAGSIYASWIPDFLNAADDTFAGEGFAAECSRSAPSS